MQDRCRRTLTRSARVHMQWIDPPWGMLWGPLHCARKWRRHVASRRSSSSISTTTPSGELPTTSRQLLPPPVAYADWVPGSTVDCRSERRRTRLLERRYRKSRSDEDRTAWVEQMRSMHALYERKENLYWTTCIANEAGNPRKMWNSVSAVLRRCKDPTVQPSCLTADILSKFFKDKIDAVRMETDKADPPTYSSYSGDEFSGFREYSMEEIRGVLIRSPAKTCSLDPIPTDVLLESIDILLPFICLMCNSSLSEGCLPGSQKAAIITPVLKKSNLDQDDAKNYRPISNLTFISKVIERIVAEQIKKHLVDSNLMPPLQSAYRAGHSTETALIKSSLTSSTLLIGSK